MMLNAYTITDRGIQTGIPIEIMAKAFGDMAKKDPTATVDSLPSSACVYRSPRLDPASMLVKNAETGKVENVKFPKSGMVWVPTSSLAYIQLANGRSWTLAVAANGSAEITEGVDPSIKVDPQIPEDATPLVANALRWLKEGRVGSSSRQMCLTIAGVGEADGWGPHHPHDPSDLRRCLAFLEAVPEARAELGKMRGVSPAWAALVDRWEDLETALAAEMRDETASRRTYDLMREILDPIEHPQPRRPGP